MNNWFDGTRGRYLQHIESTHGIKASRLLLFAHLHQSVIPGDDESDRTSLPSEAGSQDDGMLDPDSEDVGVYFRNRAMAVFVDGHVTTIGLEEWRDGDRSWSDLTKALCEGTW